ncbi:MAG TPA: DEAD/DEAH box helicase family protein, partial [Campylobacterales bacterium]|nr:DEAD/DEAH box helicase family protein [Campylobacterales bacterium]
MNSVAERIRWRMSLRVPQIEALEIFNALTDSFSLAKDFVLEEELAKAKALYPTCSDFERAFPSVCFSIATGVGKTRLMAAFMAYLYLKKGMKNFFVLAPNLTIYDKLIEDFGNPTHPKYTFHGFNEFVSDRPMVITGENYTNYGGRRLDNAMTINVFNIAKFNSENRGGRGGEKGKPPKMKRLSEYLGESYFDYLASLPDLVVLMDEAHRYHADASKNAINELRPVLGVEMTATPIDEKGKVFKNVVYEYSLAKALDDGLYVKNPTIATRKNFIKEGKSDEEIERIKLEDAISVHEDTKTALELYARESGAKRVKPFILVVCRDTTHAKDTYEYIRSNGFFKGAYKDKVLQIDSTTKNEDDVAQQFLTVEH